MNTTKTIAYDKHYEIENLFGDPYPSLIQFMDKQKRGRVLDLGCGQGRDALAFAKMGFEVTGVDHSQVGIDQMVKASGKGKLKGIVADIYEFKDISTFDFILLNSMFHFTKNDKEKEISLISRVATSMDDRAQLIICIQDTGKKVDILRKTLERANVHTVYENKFIYSFKDQAFGHESNTNYMMIVASKLA